jgi:hypothetical protein
MSIYDDDELSGLDAVRFETQIGTSKVRFRTPKPPGVKVTLEISPRPRGWDERKGPGQSGAFLVPTGTGLATAKLKITYCATTAADRERLRVEHNEFLDIVGSPVPGNPEKRFIINHPTAMLMSPPFTECVFLGDPPTPHDEFSGTDSIEFEIKESRKQQPTLTSTTAPGGNTAEGQAKDELAELVAARGTELQNLANQAGFTNGGGATL